MFYDDLYNDPSLPVSLRDWLLQVRPQVEAQLALDGHGKMAAWQAAVDQLPELTPSSIDLVDKVHIGTAADVDDQTRAQLRKALMALHPWRKGPFEIYGLDLNTEWRSDWKWARFKDEIQPLDGRRVLDIGCGNGYHCWLMHGAGARQVIGLDPFLVFVMQFQALKKLIGRLPVHVLPLGIEDLAAEMQAFDTVFSMGVLYHRRSPFDHLLELREALRPGGELVLETIVIEGQMGEVLVPEGRYAQMRNVWFLPSVPTLESWLHKCRFTNIRVVDVTPTTTAEQRPTEWMTFHSLENYLDPHDPQKTVEGHPAPIRAVIVAQAPG